MVELHRNSLSEFAGLPFALLEAAKARSVLQIGLGSGDFTEQLADWAGDREIRHMVIDAAPSRRQLAFFLERTSLIYTGNSLDLLPELPPVDAYIIDGDHNHYTVFHELQLIAARRPRDGTFPLVLVHAVGWPCGRRDFYRQPDRLPGRSRQRYSFHLGTRPGTRLAVNGGLRGDGAYAIALTEGGPGNGILTAIEDFLHDFPHLFYAEIPCFHGLGIIADPLQALRLKPLLAPYAGNPLLARLEEDRLNLYLEVLRLQDELAAMSMDMQKAL
ncbi:MAG TPA: hypothetical protein VM639_06265 [Dongiaceae bacterium]|nr:hypothetical protein [Dongiaceae bacterium]